MRHTILLKGSMPFVTLLLLAASCHTPYHLTSIERSRILIDSRYDAHPDAAAAAFIKPYEHTVDSLMKPVVGCTAAPMVAHKPESNLSNLLSDILVWGGEEFNEQLSRRLQHGWHPCLVAPGRHHLWRRAQCGAVREPYLFSDALRREDAPAFSRDSSAWRRGGEP